MSLRLTECGFPNICPNNCQKPTKDSNGCYKCNCGLGGAKCPPMRSCGCGTYLDRNGCEACGCTFEESKNSNKSQTTATTETTTVEAQPDT